MKQAKEQRMQKITTLKAPVWAHSTSSFLFGACKWLQGNNHFL